MAREILPHGAVTLLHWQQRFERLGMTPRDAWGAALNPTMRHALDACRFELMPHWLDRRQLGCVIDVGMNEGQWLEALLSIARASRVEAFEPNPSVIPTARQRLKRWAVSIHTIALGSNDGTADLHVTARSDFASLHRPRPELAEYYEASAQEVVRTTAVPIRRLDDVLPPELEIDILKVDVQGGEREVFAGGVETLRRTKVLLVEANFVSHYENDDTVATLLPLLEHEYDFAFWNLSQPHVLASRPLWADAVFVNRARVG